MEKRWIAAAAAAALVALGGVYAARPAHAPSGQPPLKTLSTTNLSEFGAAFDASPGVPRIVLLLSPT